MKPILGILWYSLMIGLLPVCALGLTVLIIAPGKFDLQQRASLIVASLATAVFWAYSFPR